MPLIAMKNGSNDTAYVDPDNQDEIEALQEAGWVKGSEGDEE